MIKGKVEVPKLDAQIRKLEGYNAIAQQEFTGAMSGALNLSIGDVQTHSPMGGGTLRSSVTGGIKYAMGDVVRGVIEAEARAPNGFPYGYALDASKRYHYRGRRKQTKGWLSRVRFRKRRDVLGQFDGALDRIVKRLEVE